MKTKKGISPLIAAVMLMALVVSIGAVIMTWTKQYVGESLDEADETLASEGVCGNDVYIELVEIDDEKQICFQNGTFSYNIDMTLSNGAKVDLEGLWVQIITSDNIYENQSNFSKDAGETFLTSVRVTSGGAGFTRIPDDLKRMVIRPVVYFESSEGLLRMVCKDHSIERTLIKEC